MSPIYLDTLAVIVKSKDGNVYQLALTDDDIELLKTHLKDYFPNGILKILPNELSSISIVNKDDVKK